MSKIKELEKRIKALEEKCAETLRILEKLKTDNTADPTSKVHITSKAIESINPTIVPIQSEKKPPHYDSKPPLFARDTSPKTKEKVYDCFHHSSPLCFV